MTEQTQTKKGNKSFVIILLVVIILILIGAVAFLLLGGSALGLIGGKEPLPEAEFIVSMDQLVLRPDDMKEVYNYAAGGDVRMDNSQFIKNMGSEYARPFISATGRVDGWDVSMERSDPNAFTPAFVRSQVSYFEDADGAKLALSKDYFWAYQVEDRIPDKFVDENCDLGDDCLLYMSSEAKAGSGSIIERYDVAFRYNNIVVWVVIKGAQGEVTSDLVLEYGQMILDKLSALN